MNRGLHTRGVRDGGLLARALLIDRGSCGASCLVGALDRSEQLRIHGLDGGAIDGLNGPLHL